MALSRAFVSFSSADLRYYRTMMMWNANEHIDFEFADFQLDEAINSANPYYIRSVCRNKIRRADTFILLIGNDTWKKDFVRYEVEVAIEKGCRLVGMNLNCRRSKDQACPSFFANKGALFIPFSSRIAAEALKPWTRPAALADSPVGDWSFDDSVYLRLGYRLESNTAILPAPPNPFQSARPPWAK